MTEQTQSYDDVIYNIPEPDRTAVIRAIEVLTTPETQEEAVLVANKMASGEISHPQALQEYQAVWEKKWGQHS